MGARHGAAVTWLANLLAGFFGQLVKGLADAFNERMRQREADAAQRQLGAQDQALRDAATERAARDSADAIRNRPAGSDDELFDRARAKRESGS